MPKAGRRQGILAAGTPPGDGFCFSRGRKCEHRIVPSAGRRFKHQSRFAAKRGIIIKNAAALEQIDNCRTLIFDKTGTLTYGKPVLTEVLCEEGFSRSNVLCKAASLEQYSKHPPAGAVLKGSEGRGFIHRAGKPGQREARSRTSGNS